MYDIVTECSWIIEAAKDELIELQFLSMDIEIYTEATGEYSCIFDYVEVNNSCSDPERGSGGPTPSTPMKNHKHIVFLSNTCPDPLNNHKSTKPAFNVGP